MTSSSESFELTLFERDHYAPSNEPARRLLLRLRPKLRAFVDRMLDPLTNKAGLAYRFPEPDEIVSGFLGELHLDTWRMSLNVAVTDTARRFGPLPGHFGVFFTVSYPGQADPIPDLTILVPVSYDGHPDHKVWLESTTEKGERTPPQRKLMGDRKDAPEALFDLVFCLVERGLAHHAQLIGAEAYEIGPLQRDVGRLQSGTDSPVYTLWSQFLIRFDVLYREILERHYPRTLPICWPAEIKTYPGGLFAQIRLPSASVDLTVYDADETDIIEIAEIKAVFYTGSGGQRVETSTLTMRVVIDASGTPRDIVSCVGVTKNGVAVHDSGESLAWRGRDDGAFEGLVAYLIDRIIGHQEAAPNAGRSAGSVIGYADDDGGAMPVSVQTPTPDSTTKARIAPSQEPAGEESPGRRAIPLPLRMNPQGQGVTGTPATQSEPAPVPLYKPLDAAALAGKTPVKIYDFAALERELAAQPPDEDGDRPSPGQIQTIARLHRLGEEGATRWLEHGHAAMIEALTDVGRRAPHFGPVTDFILTYVRASLNTGTPLRLPPTLIVDEPGTGKTWYLSRIAAALGVPFASLSMAAVTTGDTIQGSHPVWRNASQGIVSKLLLTHAIANGVVFVDEFDKPTDGGGARGSLYRPYYAALERENARQFTDDFLGLAMNASHLLWVLAANAIDPLPDPIRDRVTQITLAPMTPAHRRLVAASIYQDCNADFAGWYQPEIGEAALAVLEAHTPRQMRKAIDHALAQAGADNRRTLTAADLEAGLALSRMGERRTAIGFTAA